MDAGDQLPLQHHAGGPGEIVKRGDPFRREAANRGRIVLRQGAGAIVGGLHQPLEVTQSVHDAR